MILKNNFHNTEYRTRKTKKEIGDIERKAPWYRTETEKAFVRKVKKALCGVDGCTCSDELGTRQ